MIDTTKIYLITNCYGIPNKVYIGKEKFPKSTKRVNQHLKKFGKNINFTYIDDIISLNRIYWKPLEQYWIEQFRQWGFDIQNKNKGGSGPCFVTEEVKRKISNANKGNKYNLGHKQSKEHIDKLILSRKGRKEKPNITQLRISKLKNRKQSKEEKIKRAKSISKRIIQYDLKGNFIKEWESMSLASNKLHISISSISACCLNKIKTPRKFVFKYK